MQLHEFFASDTRAEMAYTQKKAERVITALERPINDHLLKLWTIPQSSDRAVWIRDLVNWIDEVAEIVLRPANTRPSHSFYYKLLFFEPFGGGSEIPNMLRRLRRLHYMGFPSQVDTTPDAVVARLRTFHRDLASRCASKLMYEDQIRDFLDDH